MKRFVLLLMVSIISASLFAQQDDVEKLHETARAFMAQHDYANASLILLRALKQDPENIAIAKDLAFDYYLQKENDKAIKVIVPFLDQSNVDDQAFQIAGMIYKAMKKNKDAENIYKKAIKKFPESGPIYYDYGELLFSDQNVASIKIWEAGIQKDPSYAGNYYSATKYYYLSKDKIWPLIYGEIFVNMESFTPRTSEIKNILLDGYKKLFNVTDLTKDSKNKNPFEMAFLTCMNNQGSLVFNGINAESLTMIRTRFILDWAVNYKDKFPFSLFDLQEQLLKQGLFTAYNQWIFGSAQNLAAYETWTKTYSKENTAFTQYQRDRIFKIPEGEFYH